MVNAGNLIYLQIKNVVIGDSVAGVIYKNRIEIINMNKRFLGAILTVVCIIFSASFLAAQKRQVMIDRVVAIVGGSAILHSDVTMFAEQIVQSRRAQGFTSDRDPMNESLEALMKQKLLFHQSQIDSNESICASFCDSPRAAFGGCSLARACGRSLPTSLRSATFPPGEGVWCC